jgi:hypothetical protein
MEVEEETFLEQDHLLGQTTTTYKSEIDYNFYLFNRFLEGMRATVFAPNAMRCSQKVQLFSNQVNNTVVIYEIPHNKNTTPPEDYVFNMTQVISSSGADAVGECYTTSYSVYAYTLMR